MTEKKVVQTAPPFCILPSSLIWELSTDDQGIKLRHINVSDPDALKVCLHHGSAGQMSG